MNRPFALSASIILLFSTADRMMTPIGKQVRARPSWFRLKTCQWLANRKARALLATRKEKSTLIQGMKGTVYKSFRVVLDIIRTKESKRPFVDVENGHHYHKIRERNLIKPINKKRTLLTQSILNMSRQEGLKTWRNNTFRDPPFRVFLKEGIKFTILFRC